MNAGKINYLKFILLLVILAASLIATLILIQGMAAKHLATDFAMFYESAKALLAHQDIYGSTPWQHYQLPAEIVKTKIYIPIAFVGIYHSANLNPPLLSLLVAPFALLSYGQALWLWNLLSLACAIITIVIVINTLYPQKDNLLLILATMAACFSVLPFYSNIGLGELGLFITLFLVLGWRLARQDKQISAGMVLGFALSLKLFVGMFLIYFLVQKRWRLLTSMVICFIGSALVAFMVVGSRGYLEYYGVLHTITWFATNRNASFYGYLVRLFNGLVNSPTSQSVWLMSLIYILGSLVITALVIWAAKCRQSLLEYDLGFSITIIAMLLISPLGWVYYFPLLLIPIFVIIHFINNRYYSDTMVFLLLAAIFLACIPYKFHLVRNVHDLLLILTSYSDLFYALLIFMGLLLFAHKKMQHKHYTVCNSQLTGRQFPLGLIWLALLPSLNLLLMSAFRPTF